MLVCRFWWSGLTAFFLWTSLFFEKSRRCDDNQQITVSHFGEHKRLHLESSKQNYYIISCMSKNKSNLHSHAIYTVTHAMCTLTHAIYTRTHAIYTRTHTQSQFHHTYISHMYKRQRHKRWLIFACQFPERSPIISVSFAERNLHCKASCASSPPCTE